MKKKVVVFLFMFFAGWGVGLLYKPTFIPEDSKISECNRISKYEFYDYEEAVLKEGNRKKLDGIIGECGVDRFPYLIVMYDVYHENVCSYLGTFYSLLQKRWHKKHPVVDVPIHEFVRSVLTEYAERGDEVGMRKLQYFIEEEQYEKE